MSVCKVVVAQLKYNVIYFISVSVYRGYMTIYVLSAYQLIAIYTALV